jgi:hypothetical protein
LSVKTQLKYFEMFKQLLIWARTEDFIDKVPGSKLKVGGAKKLVAGDLRDPYSQNQLTKIFSSPSMPATSRKKSVINLGASIGGTDISGCP